MAECREGTGPVSHIARNILAFCGLQREHGHFLPEVSTLQILLNESPPVYLNHLRKMIVPSGQDWIFSISCAGDEIEN